jgi:hypothetical protein
LIDQNNTDSFARKNEIDRWGINVDREPVLTDGIETTHMVYPGGASIGWNGLPIGKFGPTSD